MKDKNVTNIKYTLASEGNSVIRDIKINSGLNYIEASNNDLATFFTQYPDTLVEGLYWGKGLSLGYDYGDKSDYFYTSEDTVKVSNGVASDTLKVNRLPMYSVYLIKAGSKNFTLKSISINGIEVARPNKVISSESSNVNIASFIQDYMSYNADKTLEYSVVVSKNNVDTTLTASIDLSKDNKILLDCSTIQ